MTDDPYPPFLLDYCRRALEEQFAACLITAEEFAGGKLFLSRLR